VPYESNDYAARESVVHVVPETLNWCDAYLGKEPKARTSK